MIELKTLKDLKKIEILSNSCGNDCEHCKIVFLELKEEMIKWVKALSQNEDNKDYWNDGEFKQCTEINIFPYEQDDAEGAKIILKHIFEITEDELK